MSNLTGFCVTTTVENALKKLSKAKIAVFKLKKQGANVYFYVEQEYEQKVFAIFSHPCYNIRIRRKSAKARLKGFLAIRFGLVVGAALFIAACVLSNALVLKIKVVGNGSYLSPRVLAAASDCGVKIGTPCLNMDKPLLTSRILSLPEVTFCSVQRRGSYLVIEVHTDEEHSPTVNCTALKSNCEGEVRRVVVLSGTAEVGEGQKVAAGDILIGAYRVTESGERQDALAVGYVEIIRRAAVTVFFESESEQNAAAALAATALYGDEVLEKSFKVNPCDGGFNYDVSFTYVTTLSINMQ